MLSFLRRHQRILFACITVVIVISFSFFGTYSAFVSQPTRDGLAFVAVDGSRVYHSELQDLMSFISTDSLDERMASQPYSGNGLNDGVFAQDICGNNLATVIAKPFLQQLSSDLNTRFEREKAYVPYKHPHAPFINAELVWNYFAPDIKKHFDALRGVENPLIENAFTSRVQLFLAERQFPALYLKQLIRYQEAQQKSVQQDDQLLSRDLSLFGYHQAQDWFGKTYLELVAKYIINVAKQAESEGCLVTKEEALASLFANARETFTESKLNQYYGIIGPGEYLQTTVHRLGMDQGRAVHVWRWVLTFRRYIAEKKGSILLDNLAFRDFYNHRNEFVDVEVYTLPQELSIRNIEDMEKFDLYVKAVTHSKNRDSTQPFVVPDKMLPPSEVKKLYPDLVKRSFKLQYALVKKQEIEGKIGLLKTWQWQVGENNWKVLQAHFAELAQVKAPTEEARHAALDALDEKVRTKIDAFSRSEIVDQHPEWIQEALSQAAMKEVELSLREQGGAFPFTGITDRHAFFALLDEAKLGEQSEALNMYSQDGSTYYRFVVQERGDESVLSYEEALRDATLERLLNTVLDLTYQRVRKEKPSRYLAENGEWKPLAVVKSEIASVYFDEQYMSLDMEVEKFKKALPHLTSWEDRQKARVACRLATYMQNAQEAIKQDSESFAKWKLVKNEKRVLRNTPDADIDSIEAFSLPKHSWSKLQFMGTSGLVFYKVVEKGIADANEEVRARVLQAKELLGHAAIVELGTRLLEVMQQKDAIQIEKPQDLSS